MIEESKRDGTFTPDKTPFFNAQADLSVSTIQKDTTSESYANTKMSHSGREPEKINFMTAYYEKNSKK